MARYIHEQKEWPQFAWSAERLVDAINRVYFRRGLLEGRINALGFAQQKATTLESIVREVRKSSEIEGENLDELQVRSSVARRLGFEAGGLPEPLRNVDGVVEMIMDATTRFAEPLTTARLFRWHRLLFPTGHNGYFPVRVGHWRDDAKGQMEIVSGQMGNEKVHFVAPDAPRVEFEMDQFMRWFEGNQPELDLVLKAGIAHLWFVTIHPFEDGNGRIGRAVAEMALTRADQRPMRCYSMSAQIRTERSAYYKILEKTQRSGLDITEWLLWFTGCLERALISANESLEKVIIRSRFWQDHDGVQLNERQRKILIRLLDGFEGKMNNERWARMNKCSHDTALRDLKDLVEKGILQRTDKGGRSTSYVLAIQAAASNANY